MPIHTILSFNIIVIITHLIVGTKGSAILYLKRKEVIKIILNSYL